MPHWPKPASTPRGVGYWSRCQGAENDRIATFAAAAEGRFFDGMALWAGEATRRQGAHYLFGYAAELSLKVAYFRFVGLNEQGYVWNLLQNAPGGHLDLRVHDLGALGRELALLRAATANDPVFEGEIVRQASLAHAEWSEVMRYRTFPPTDAETTEVAEAAYWLLTHLEEMSR